MVDLYDALDRIEAADDWIELPPGASSLDFLQAIYRDTRQPLQRRMRAATAALPFEVPKLAVTAIVDAGADFAAKLERARLRSAGVIEGRTIEARAEPPLVSDVRLAPPVADRRFR